MVYQYTNKLWSTVKSNISFPPLPILVMTWGMLLPCTPVSLALWRWHRRHDEGCTLSPPPVTNPHAPRPRREDLQLTLCMSNPHRLHSMVDLWLALMLHDGGARKSRCERWRKSSQWSQNQGVDTWPRCGHRHWKGVRRCEEGNGAVRVILET